MSFSYIKILKPLSRRINTRINIESTRDSEVSNPMLDGPQSIAFDQAENRLHGQKAVMELTMRK